MIKIYKFGNVAWAEIYATSILTEANSITNFNNLVTMYICLYGVPEEPTFSYKAIQI